MPNYTDADLDEAFAGRFKRGYIPSPREVMDLVADLRESRAEADPYHGAWVKLKGQLAEAQAEVERLRVERDSANDRSVRLTNEITELRAQIGRLAKIAADVKEGGK